MRKISGLILHNLKKDKGQYISFGIIILLTALILNLALVLTLQVDKAYDTRFSELNTATLNFCIPKSQDQSSVKDKCMEISGVENVESREAILSNATIKDFRGVDFSIGTIFYNMEEKHSLNKFEIKEETKSNYDLPIYIPLYVAQFGEFETGEKITYQIDGKNCTFTVAGIIDEMQYGNAGSGTVCAYLPEKSYKNISQKIKENVVTEYSLKAKSDADVTEISDEINSILSEENISLLSIKDSDSVKQARTMTSTLIILILLTFAVVILLVSMFLSKFRIQNTIEEEITNMGVLKALGYTGGMIISSTVLPYLIVAVASALLGIALSYAVLPVLAQVLALQSGFSFSLYFDITALVITVLLLVGITLLFTYFAARRIKKLQPINAIRGIDEGNKEKKNHFPLDSSVAPLQISLILKQTASCVKQNILLFIVSFLVTVLLAFAGILFYNSIIEPNNLLSSLSDETADIVLQVKPQSIERLESKFANNSNIKKVLEYDQKTVKAENESLTAFICEDFANANNDLCYQGRNPKENDEVALGSALAKDYSIGDKVKIENGSTSYEYKVVGYVQSVNNQGKLCEFTQGGYRNLDNSYKNQSLYLYLKDNADAAKTLSDIEKENNSDIISSVNSAKTAKVSQDIYTLMMQVIIAVIFILTVLIVLLILYIIIKSLIVKRKRELGIYKAMGYSNRQLIMQIAGGFLPVTVVAVLSSALLGIIYLPVMNEVIFQTVGAMKNNFEISIVFLIGVAIIQIAVNFIISLCLSTPIKKITAYSLIKE
ncbi:MAG: FtsX-like permease family protein [Ruminococcus sp.]